MQKCSATTTDWTQAPGTLRGPAHVRVIHGQWVLNLRQDLLAVLWRETNRRQGLQSDLKPRASQPRDPDIPEPRIHPETSYFLLKERPEGDGTSWEKRTLGSTSNEPNNPGEIDPSNEVWHPSSVASATDAPAGSNGSYRASHRASPPNRSASSTQKAGRGSTRRFGPEATTKRVHRGSTQQGYPSLQVFSTQVAWESITAKIQHQSRRGIHHCTKVARESITASL